MHSTQSEAQMPAIATSRYGLRSLEIGRDASADIGHFCIWLALHDFLLEFYSEYGAVVDLQTAKSANRNIKKQEKNVVGDLQSRSRYAPRRCNFNNNIIIT